MAPTKSGWTKYGTDQIWLDQKWLRPNMGLEQIWVGPNMGPTKYAGPNLVRPKMADQKCLDQIWLDTYMIIAKDMEIQVNSNASCESNIVMENSESIASVQVLSEPSKSDESSVMIPNGINSNGTDNSNIEAQNNNYNE